MTNEQTPQATPKRAALVALESVELTRDTTGMCVVKVNGREAIRDNGEVINHFATPDWFADRAERAAPADLVSA